ncbi:MAG: hypothetical protein EXX96DRAFT_615661 [Benjaminiella poitrasii]|nr:MAG: hypothetical protein EXX96DRAFT_615661 [Benjaminiella poitrasii]
MSKPVKSNLISFGFEIPENPHSSPEGVLNKIFDKVLTKLEPHDHNDTSQQQSAATTTTLHTSPIKQSNLDSTSVVIPRSSSSSSTTTATTITVGNPKFDIKQDDSTPQHTTVQFLMPPSKQQEDLVDDFLLQPLSKKKSVDSDTQSIVTNFSISNSNSLSKILARLRGQKNDKEFWMPDEQCKECYKCRKPFTFLRRKHHCRTCGQIFCGKCASHVISGKVFKQKGQVRVCNFCYAEHHNEKNRLATPSAVTSSPVLPPSIVNTSANTSTNNFEHNLNTSTASLTPISPLPAQRHNFTDEVTSSYSSSAVIPSLQKPPPVAPKMQIPTTALKQAHNHYGNVDTTTFAFEIPSSPSNTMDFPVIANDSGLKRLLLDAGTSLLNKTSRPRSNTSSSAPLLDDQQRSHLFSSLLDRGGGTVLAESELSPFPATNTNPVDFYQDQLHHHPSTPPPKLLQSDDELYDRRTEELRGRSKKRAKIRINTIGLPKTSQQDQDWSPNPFLSPFLIEDNNKFSPSNTETRLFRFPPPPPPLPQQQRRPSNQPMVELSLSARTHARNMLRQLIQDPPNLSRWEDVLMQLLLKTTNHVRPDVRAGDDMDVRHYVKIKKIPGGQPSDSFYVQGVMCTKNVAHKGMVRPLRNPKILILMFSLDYSRVEMENQLLSIEPVISQEREHIRQLVARIVALRPSLVIVKSTVSRLALEFLLEAQIPVVHHVKQSVLEAIARCTQASIVTSVDKLQQAVLGRCGSFEIKTIMHEWIPNRRKTYLVFDECAPELGGTIVLRGGRVEGLRAVKRWLDFMMFVVNNLKLETSLLLDSFVKSQHVVASSPLQQQQQQEQLQVDYRGSHIDDLLRLYETRILTVSQFIVYPPPYLLLKLKETEDALRRIRHGHSSIGSQQSSPTLFEKQQQKHQMDLESALDMEHELAQRSHRISRAWEAYMGENPESISPFYHQNIVVLYSSVCTVTTVPCQGPEIRVFSYYRYPSDTTLGQYLLDLFQDARQTCSSFMCDHPMTQHYRSYAHGSARIIVMMEPFTCPLPGMSDKLLMWSYCQQCKKYTPVMPMSENTWNYSFGKFLEILLYQRGVTCRADMCPHDIGQTHVRFFGYNDLAIHFQYDTIDLLEVSPPPMTLFIQRQVQIDLKEAELRSLRAKINKFYQSLMERNKSFPFDLVDPRRLERCKVELQEMSMEAEGERKDVLQLVQNVYATTDPLDTLTIQVVRRHLFQVVTRWETIYTDFVQYYLQPERELKKLTTIQLKKMFPTDDIQTPTMPERMAAEVIDLPLLGQEMEDEEEELCEFPIMPTLSPHSSVLEDSPSVVRPEVRRRLSLELMRELNNNNQNTSLTRLPLLLTNEKAKTSRKRRGHQRYHSLGGSGGEWKTAVAEDHKRAIKRLLPRKNTYIQVYTQANDLVQEEERDEFMDDEVPWRRRHTEDHLGLSRFHSDQGQDVDYFSALAPYAASVVQQPPDKKPWFDGLETASSGDEREDALPSATELLNKLQPAGESDQIIKPDNKTSQLDDIIRHASAEKVSFMKTLTNFLTDSGVGNLLPLELPLQPTEYLFPDSYVVVREDEPSTIIAYTLSSEDYLEKMHDIHAPTIAGTTSSESTLEDDIQETLLRESGTHMRYNFSTGSSKFFCKIFFSEQFDALRRNCGCQESYIMSLANCALWDSSGGKSGSAFLKTKDDRFLMKQMSRYELDAFLRFAPAYFQYMSEAFFSELPTVLAKIFGFYSIGFKNGTTGKSMRMDVLVMENLFYQRKVKKIFDLKGSMRNRHVQSTGKQDEVLLDENLVELIYQSPLFIRAHSKEILRSSLHNDTLFLSTRNVMDYSLLVGIDEERHELVVGIVDFIRTFTWDKKLESWVKESGILGGGGKEPTIVSPRQYRIRFREAMERYFLMVPDFWALIRQNKNLLLLQQQQQQQQQPPSTYDSELDEE